MPEWIFVIDTEQYAGNFEREMCAYVTGMLGDCGVGDEETAVFDEEISDNPFANVVSQRADEHGCHRPTSIWPTPGWYNHGMGGHYREGDDDEAALADFNQKITAYADDNRMAADHPFRTKEGKLTKHDAFLSVAIFFHENPTDELIEIMKQRAKAFVAKYCPNREKEWKRYKITITGFRLLKGTDPTLVKEWK